MAASRGMSVTFILADAAQVVGGKLFVLGGGWNLSGPGGSPIPMGVGLVIRVPWNETNQRHKFQVALMTEDGAPVPNPEGEGIRVEGEFEIGRPAGIRPGSSFNAPFAVQLNPVLPSGGYRWEVNVDGTVLATESFTVLDRNPAATG